VKWHLKPLHDQRWSIEHAGAEDRENFIKPLAYWRHTVTMTQSNSIDSTTKCNDTTAGNTPSTSAKSHRQKPLGGLQTEPKPQEQEGTQNDEKSQKLAEQPHKEFVITDLKLWTFKMRDANGQAHEYTARNCPVEHWAFFFSEYANLDPATDWTDLEERADFLTKLWSFCYQHTLSFPLVEKLNAG